MQLLQTNKQYSTVYCFFGDFGGVVVGDPSARVSESESKLEFGARVADEEESMLHEG